MGNRNIQYKLQTHAKPYRDRKKQNRNSHSKYGEAKTIETNSEGPFICGSLIQQPSRILLMTTFFPLSRSLY